MTKKSEPESTSTSTSTKTSASTTTSLRIRGDYKGTQHKEYEKTMHYIIRIRVEDELRKDLVAMVLDSGDAEVIYRVPSHVTKSAETITILGKILDARPDNVTNIWLKELEPDNIVFQIAHPAEYSVEVHSLLNLLSAIDLDIEARILPLQPRLL